MTIATKEEAHKTIRVFIIAAAVLVGMYLQSHWVAVYVHESTQECPRELTAVQNRCAQELRTEEDKCKTMRRQIRQVMSAAYPVGIGGD